MTPDFIPNVPDSELHDRSGYDPLDWADTTLYFERLRREREERERAATMPRPQAVSPIQFTEATIILKMSVQLREVQETDTDGKKRTAFRAFGSNVNFRTKNTFSYDVEASGSVTAIMRPVPPPGRLLPSIVTVNTLVQPPTVTVNNQ